MFYGRPMNDPLLPTDVTSITLLIERARLGCENSRANLLKRLQPFLNSIAARHNDPRSRSKQGLSDIVQQSFVRVIENFDNFRGNCGAELRGWLKQLVINEIRQVNRRLHQQRRDLKRERSLDEKRELEGSTISTPEPNAESQAMQAEEVQQLRQSMSDLDPSQRRIVELRAFENLTFAEIASRLGRSQDAVTKSWYRSLIQLQKKISSDNSPEQDA